MDEATKKSIREDFLVWSGGFEPESDYQIYVYVDAALDSAIDAGEATQFLRDWMAEDFELPDRIAEN